MHVIPCRSNSYILFFFCVAHFILLSLLNTSRKRYIDVYRKYKFLPEIVRRPPFIFLKGKIKYSLVSKPVIVLSFYYFYHVMKKYRLFFTKKKKEIPAFIAQYCCIKKNNIHNNLMTKYPFCVILPILPFRFD